MRTHVAISGADYALVGDHVTYVISELDTPTDKTPEDGPPEITDITWTKNGVEIPQYPDEEQTSLKLWDVDYPAEGDYQVIVTFIVDGDIVRGLSNIIHLTIGEAPKQIEIEILSRDVVPLKLGETLVLSPTVTADPITSEISFAWTHNGTDIGHSNTLYIDHTDPVDFGTYIFEATANNDGAYIPATGNYTIEVVERIDPPEDTCFHWNTVPIKPTKGFTWMGYWVIDEIKQANKDGFDWESDPMNKRFKYGCQIGLIVGMMNKYDEVCVMSSKNGRRWNKNDLKTRTEDIYYQYT